MPLKKIQTIKHKIINDWFITTNDEKERKKLYEEITEFVFEHEKAVKEEYGDILNVAKEVDEYRKDLEKVVKLTYNFGNTSEGQPDDKDRANDIAEVLERMSNNAEKVEKQLKRLKKAMHKLAA